MTIRTPSTEAETYNWWRRTVAGERVPRVEDDPQPGFYKTRSVRGGPFVPVAIWLEQEIDDETGELTAPERLAAVCNGEPKGEAWIFRNWTYLRAVSAEAYDALTGARDRHEEMAATHARINVAEMPAIRP